MRVAKCPFCKSRMLIQDYGDKYDPSFSVECSACSYGVTCEDERGYTPAGIIKVHNELARRANSLKCPKCKSHKIILSYESLACECGHSVAIDHDGFCWDELFDKFEGKENSEG